MTNPGGSQSGALSRARCLRQIAATTDVHSALADAASLAAHLHGLRADTLLADCGDFFEGTGYYALGGGVAETTLLTSLYDVVAPGNHGYRHHVRDPGLRAITVCANIAIREDAPVFEPLRVFDICGSAVAVTAVIGTEAFTSIPPADRAGQRVLDPAQALRALHERNPGIADSWIVLSHAGFAHDLDLARACQFTDVIFSGHCHSQNYGPVTVGKVTVVKGAELAAGYAVAWPGRQWRATARRFPPPSAPAGPPAGLAAVLRRVREMSGILAEPVGPLAETFAFTTPTRPELLHELTLAAMPLTGADVAMFNETCLRPAQLGPVLRRGDLMTIEPFGNSLACVRTANPLALARDLAGRCGALVCAPGPPPAAGPPAVVVTTSYLADTHLSACHQIPYPDPRCGGPLLVRDVLRDVLLAKTTSPDSEITWRTE